MRGLVSGQAVPGTRSSATLGYNELRHGAIGLDQFLPELFLGIWVGDDRAETVRFARDGDDLIRPRHIFEIQLRNGNEPDGQI